MNGMLKPIPLPHAVIEGRGAGFRILSRRQRRKRREEMRKNAKKLRRTRAFSMVYADISGKSNSQAPPLLRPEIAQATRGRGRRFRSVHGATHRRSHKRPPSGPEKEPERRGAWELRKKNLSVPFRPASPYPHAAESPVWTFNPAAVPYLASDAIFCFPYNRMIRLMFGKGKRLSKTSAPSECSPVKILLRRALAESAPKRSRPKAASSRRMATFQALKRRPTCCPYLSGGRSRSPARRSRSGASPRSWARERLARSRRHRSHPQPTSRRSRSA